MRSSMRFPFLRVLSCAPAVVAGFALMSMTADAQAPAAKVAKPAALPRMADGKPKIAGVWQGGGVSLLGEKGAPPKVAPQEITVPMPPRDQLSYKPAWEEKRKTLTVKEDPSLYCLMAGVPRITTQPFPFEIVQTPEKIVILYEVFHAFRNIPIRQDLKHPDDMTPTWMGDSVARWEGDTLVVDVQGFNDKTWLAGTGSIHSEALHVTERYALNPDGTMTYAVTAEDPEALTKPWHTGTVLRHPAPDVRVEEYECVENNQDIPHMGNNGKSY